MDALAAVIITEIMYNPASDEMPPVQTEWVELYNPGRRTVPLEGWYLQDEDGRTQPIPARVTLDPGEALVLIPGEQRVPDFRRAWGRGFQVVPLKKWARGGIYGLANTPGEANERLTLRYPSGGVADAVNYDHTEPWPEDNDRASIHLRPGHFNAKDNDKGANWRLSEADAHGARHPAATGDYDGRDVGSPGFVPSAKAEKDHKAGE